MSTAKILKLKKVDGVYQGSPFYGTRVAIHKNISGQWQAVVSVDDLNSDARSGLFGTLRAACIWVDGFGDQMVYTHNIMNPDAGTFTITRRQRGTCVDPATERYHSM